ncbi:S-adenosyl-L-methionine-dependent methyltransferase [Fistulina hepatica ATCC 64428]|uniref:S-adenosyl-L-methionine-dependent methyltransferase n=1 Tax=Fistulina hepatica ATCC 64428 TaxID=1128425 RepID=A0A0D7ASS9_9AGAR|nr:S-adenosyl-L-methionine-dependent methyltransferase [Fistulina hepatica ATCC 64428]
MESSQSRPAPLRTLLELRELLDKSISIISEEWERNGPTVRDLDDNTVPADNSTLPNARVFEASKTAVGAAGMLQVLLTDSIMYLIDSSCTQNLEIHATRAVMAARVPDIIYEHGVPGQGMEVKDIARVCGYDTDKCRRVLHLLASKHIFKQTGPDSFDNNRISTTLIHNPGLYTFMGLTFWPPTAPQFFVEGMKSPHNDIHHAPMTLAFEGKTLWDFIDTAADNGVLFSQTLSLLTHTEAAVEGYAWNELGTAKIVDVGGGLGTLAILKRYPKLTLVLQDRGTVILDAKEHWRLNYPAAVDAGRVEFQAADFFQPNPTTDADAYMLRHVMHDWNDDVCIHILTAIKNVMRPDAKVLVVENLRTSLWGGDPSQAGPNTGLVAPRPLPRNFGIGDRYVNGQDMWMYWKLNGKERTTKEMTNIVLFRSGMWHS